MRRTRFPSSTLRSRQIACSGQLRMALWGVSIQGPSIWAVPGSPHFYTIHGCSSLPSATDWNQHPQLPRRLVHSGPVRGSFNIAQDPPPQPLTLPGAQGQLCPANILAEAEGSIRSLASRTPPHNGVYHSCPGGRTSSGWSRAWS